MSLGNTISANTGTGIEIRGMDIPVFQWETASGGNGHYYLLAPPRSWQDAEAAAVTLGGHLASIASQDEQDFIDSTILGVDGYPSEPFWIGLNDEAQEGVFEWTSGEAVTYTNWENGKPDDPGNFEYVVLNQSGSWDSATRGQWADWAAFNTVRSIIELDNAPVASQVKQTLGTGQNIVQGNFIGTDSGSATQDLGNGGDGIFIEAPDNTISSNNMIAYNDGDGVAITGETTTGNVVIGNTVDFNDGDGVYLHSGAFNNTIGGTVAGAGNSIVGNFGSGVTIEDDATTGNAIRCNEIAWNLGGLGIDLGGDGVTANDPDDADSGPNDLQNFPVMTLVVTGGTTRVVGTLHSSAGETYSIDFFLNGSLDPSGYGEGQFYLGSTSVVADGSGNAAFDVTLLAATSAGAVITATATSSAGNTSEFSAAFAADTTAPVVTVDDLLTIDTTPALTGTVDDSTASISVTVAGSTYPATNLGDGTWILADNTITPALDEGTYDVAVTATDGVGNEGSDASTDELVILASKHWDGGGDGVSWSDAANWEDDTLPGPADIVIIDVPDDQTVTHSAGTTLIKGLHCEESLVISGGSFTVTDVSQVNGALTVGSAASLIVDGATASLLASGATDVSGANLSALNGGRLELPNATSYTNTENADRTLKASGRGACFRCPMWQRLPDGAISVTICSYRRCPGARSISAG